MSKPRKLGLTPEHEFNRVVNARGRMIDLDKRRSHLEKLLLQMLSAVAQGHYTPEDAAVNIQRDFFEYFSNIMTNQQNRFLDDHVRSKDKAA